MRLFMCFIFLSLCSTNVLGEDIDNSQLGSSAVLTAYLKQLVSGHPEYLLYPQKVMQTAPDSSVLEIEEVGSALLLFYHQRHSDDLSDFNSMIEQRIARGEFIEDGARPKYNPLLERLEYLNGLDTSRDLSLAITDEYCRHLNFNEARHQLCSLSSLCARDPIFLYYEVLVDYYSDPHKPWLIGLQTTNDLALNAHLERPFPFRELQTIEEQSREPRLRNAATVVDVVFDDGNCLDWWCNELIDYASSAGCNHTQKVEILRFAAIYSSYDVAGALEDRGSCQTLSKLIETPSFLKGFTIEQRMSLLSFESTFRDWQKLNYGESSLAQDALRELVEPSDSGLEHNRRQSFVELVLPELNKIMKFSSESASASRV